MFTYVRLKREIFGIEEGRRKEYGMGEEREREGKKGRRKKKKTREMCSFLASLMDSSISFTQQILTYTRDINVMMQDLCMRIDGGNFARIRTTRWSFNDALSISRSIIAISHFSLPTRQKLRRLYRCIRMLEKRGTYYCL